MPRKEFEAFTRLDASDVNTLLMDQSVMTFASSAARGSAISAPIEGMVSYLADVNLFQHYNGTAWVSMADNTGSGLVHISTSLFTGSSSEVFNDVFTSQFRNYRILADFTTSGGTDIRFRLRVGGVPQETNYERSGFRITTEPVQTLTGATGATSFVISSATGTGLVNNISLDVFRPQLETQTGIISSGQGYAGGVARYTAELNNGVQSSESSYDGFSIFPGSGTIAGQISVYGYRRV
jgi:hypothetical protein